MGIWLLSFFSLRYNSCWKICVSFICHDTEYSPIPLVLICLTFLTTTLKMCFLQGDLLLSAYILAFGKLFLSSFKYSLQCNDFQIHIPDLDSRWLCCLVSSQSTSFMPAFTSLYADCKSKLPQFLCLCITIAHRTYDIGPFSCARQCSLNGMMSI